MRNIIRHTGRLLFILQTIICFLAAVPVAEAILPVKVVDVSVGLSKKNVLLKYIKADGKDRFIFDFPTGSKIAYDIQSNEKSTTITFSRIFRIDTQNLADFPEASQITQKRISSNRLEITFPRPLASSIEHLNSVLLDLYPTGSEETVSAPQKVKPLQISTLSFPWNSPTALAVFKRDKYLWIVFNQYQLINTTELEKSAGNMVKEILQLPHTSATILRVEAADELYSEVRKEGLLWIVDLYNQKAEFSSQPIVMTTDTSIPDKPFIQVDLPHTEDIFSFLDPEIGDMLMVVTSSAAGYAFMDGYKYPDFTFLPSSQGIAINSDEFGIGIVRNPSGFILQTMQHPLNISDAKDILKQRAYLSSEGDGINLSQELTVPIIKKTFAASEKFLKTQVQIALPKEKGKFNIELARFYLSHGLGSNAFGILRQVELALQTEDKEISPRLSGLIASAAFLMKRYRLAFDIFNRPEFARNKEIGLWKALSDTDKNHDQSMEISKNLQYIHAYPVTVKKKLVLRGAEYAADKKNDTLLQKFIDLLKELPMDEEIQAAIDYYEAEKVRMQGYVRSALPQYKNAVLSNSPYFSAMARYRIADFNSQLADVKHKLTIKELERIKFAWGEKDFKIQVLDKLVDLYQSTNRFYQALKALDIIGVLSEKQKPIIEKRMIQIMEEIYYYNNDNQFNPVKALALFDDFGYLIERSPHQTAIIIKLADRLVAVDLLDRAYTLLDTYLMKNRERLNEQEISAIGGRMALINMFKNDVDAALINLQDTEYDNISDTLRLQRRIIQAQAYVQQGLVDKALALLDGNTSRNAILLKSEIYWNARQWDKAADMLRLLVEKPTEDTDKLSEEQIRYILDWLTALKQAGRETVIVRVRNTFLPYFEKTSYASIFNLLTDHLENDTISIKDINHTIQNVQAFSDFAKQYTKSLLTEPVKEKNDKK